MEELRINTDEINTFIEYMTFFEHAKELREEGTIKRFVSPDYTIPAIRKKVSHLFLMRLRQLIGKKMGTPDAMYNYTIDRISRDTSRPGYRSEDDLQTYLRLNLEVSLQKKIHIDTDSVLDSIKIVPEDHKQMFINSFFGECNERIIADLQNNFEIIFLADYPRYMNTSIYDYRRQDYESELSADIGRLGLSVGNYSMLNRHQNFTMTRVNPVASLVKFPVFLYFAKLYGAEIPVEYNDLHFDNVGYSSSFSIISRYSLFENNKGIDNFVLKVPLVRVDTSAHTRLWNFDENRYSKEDIFGAYNDFIESDVNYGPYVYIVFSRKKTNENGSLYINPFETYRKIRLKVSPSEDIVYKGEVLKDKVQQALSGTYIREEDYE